MKCTDAVAWPSAERDISVRMSATTVFRKEAFRLKFLRIGEVGRISMQDIRCYTYSWYYWNLMSTWINCKWECLNYFYSSQINYYYCRHTNIDILHNCSGKNWHTRIETQGFLDATFKVLEFIQISHCDGPIRIAKNSVQFVVYSLLSYKINRDCVGSCSTYAQTCTLGWLPIRKRDQLIAAAVVSWP